MIDHAARNRLAVLIRRYLDDQLKAFDFDDVLDEFRDSDDDAVRFVSDTVWYHYDDCDDHFVVLSKPEWNYFQRLLLLLESNSSVTFTQYRHWTYYQLVAVVLLFFCTCVIFQTGFGYHLLLFFIPFGIGSIAISHFRHPGEESGPYDAIISPFKSLHDLRIAFKSTRFQKDHYPSKLMTRMIRSPFMNWFGMAHCYSCWAMLAPLPLLVQCFPLTATRIDIDPA